MKDRPFHQPPYAMLATAVIPSLNIWIVEDDLDYLATIENLLNNVTGMHCPMSFNSCEEITTLLDRYKKRAKPWSMPDVILLDIGLPGQNGIDGIGQIKSRIPSSSIVMLTNYDDSEKIYDSFRAGASGYLLKNVSIDQIIEAIRQASLGGMLMTGPVAEKVKEFFQPEESTDLPTLTKRELEVLFHMAEGLTQKEIADTLFITRNTVNTHVQHIYQALHVRCAAEAVATAIRKNWI